MQYSSELFKFLGFSRKKGSIVFSYGIYLTEAATIKCGELGVVPLLLQQIRSECMETSFKLNVSVNLILLKLI